MDVFGVDTNCSINNWLNELKKECAEIWRVPYMPWYTDHDMIHSESILRHIESLVYDYNDEDHFNKLSHDERIVLIAAAYVHDVGMQYFKHIGKVVDEMGAREYNAVRDRHTQTAYELVMRQYRSKSPAGIMGNPEGLCTAIPGCFQESVAEVARAHSAIAFESIHDSFYCQSTIRIKLLGALLLIGDELDLDNGRIRGLDALRKYCHIGHESLVHYYKHYYVSKVSIHKGMIEIEISYPEGMARDISVLQRHVQKKLNERFGLVKQVFRKVGLEFELNFVMRVNPSRNERMEPVFLDMLYQETLIGKYGSLSITTKEDNSESSSVCPALLNNSNNRCDGHVGWVSACVKLSKNSYISTSFDRTVKLWVCNSGGHQGMRINPVDTYDKDCTSAIETCVRLSDKEFVISYDKNVKFLEVDNNEIRESGVSIVWGDCEPAGNVKIFTVHALDSSPHRLICSGSSSSCSMLLLFERKCQNYTLVKFRSFPTDKVVTACVSYPDRLIIGFHDGEIRLLHSESLEDVALVPVTGHKAPITGCSYLNNKIISVCKGGRIVYWKLVLDSNGSRLVIEKTINRYIAHNGRINGCITVGNHLITAGNDQNCHVWDSNGNYSGSLIGDSGEIWCISDAGEGRILLGSEHKMLWIWDSVLMRKLPEGAQPLIPANPECLTSKNVMQYPTSKNVIFDRSDRGAQDCAIIENVVFGIHENGVLRIWIDQKMLGEFDTGMGWCWGCDAFKVGNQQYLVAVGSGNHSYRVYFVEIVGNKIEIKNDKNPTYEGHHKKAVWQINFFPESGDGCIRLMSCSEDGWAHLIPLHQNGMLDVSKEIVKIEHGEGICDGTVSNNRPVTASYDCSAAIWETDYTSRRILEHGDQVWCCEAFENGWILTGTKNGEICLWDKNGHKQWSYLGHNGCVHGCSVSRVVQDDVFVFATVSVDRSLVVWKINMNIKSNNNKCKIEKECRTTTGAPLNFCSINESSKLCVVAGGHGIKFFTFDFSSENICNIESV
ncbi:MAG: WD40 repeat domain-containing protein [Magnetococcales bacterium]|nr:WD40 repeat domain-containing protein [Magnetococcales bacterium]